MKKERRPLQQSTRKKNQPHPPNTLSYHSHSLSRFKCNPERVVCQSIAKVNQLFSFPRSFLCVCLLVNQSLARSPVLVARFARRSAPFVCVRIRNHHKTIRYKCVKTHALPPPAYLCSASIRTKKNPTTTPKSYPYKTTVRSIPIPIPLLHSPQLPRPTKPPPRPTSTFTITTLTATDCFADAVASLNERRRSRRVRND